MQPQSLHPRPQSRSNPNTQSQSQSTPYFNPTLHTSEQQKHRRLMETLTDAVIKHVASDPTKPLTAERKTHIEQRLRQLFPVFHTPSHPAYSAMIHRAIVELNEEGGSSEESISGFIKANYDDLPWAHASLLSHHLGRLTVKGEIVVTGEKSYMFPIVNPKPEKRGRKRKRGQGQGRGRGRGRARGRTRGRRRHSVENVVEEESGSHEQCSGVKEESEVIGEQNGAEGRKIEQCQLPEPQSEVTEGQNRAEEEKIEVREEQYHLQEGQSVVSEEHDQAEEQQIEVVEEQNEVNDLQSEVIGEQDEPQERHNEVRIEILWSCRDGDGDGDVLMVPSGESPRPLVEEERNEFLEERQQTESPFRQRVFEVIEEQLRLQEQEHVVIEEKFQPTEQQVVERSIMLPSRNDGDGDDLVVPLDGAHMLVVEEEKTESLAEEQRPHQTESPCGRSEFVVEVIKEQSQPQEPENKVTEEIKQPEEQHNEVTEEQFQPQEEQIEGRTQILQLCYDGEDGDCYGKDLRIQAGLTPKPIIKEKRNEPLEEEKQQETKVACVGREIAIVCGLPAQEQQQLAESGLQKPIMEETSPITEKQAKRCGRKKRRAASQRTTMATSVDLPQPACQTTMTTSLDLPLHSQQLEPDRLQEFLNQERSLELKRKRVEDTPKSIMKGKKRESLEEEKQQETEIPCEGSEIGIVCDLLAQQQQEQAESGLQKPIMEETSQKTEIQVKCRGQKKLPASQRITMTTSVDLPQPASQSTTTTSLDLSLHSQQLELEQQQEFLNQERSLEQKRKKVEEFSGTQEQLQQQQQQAKEKLQQRQLRPRAQGPPKDEPATATTKAALLPSQNQHEQQQQPRCGGLGRHPKAKPDADADHQHHHEQQQQPQRRPQGRTSKQKPTTTKTTEEFLPSRQLRGPGRPPKPKSDADTTTEKLLISSKETGDMLTSPKKEQEPKRGRGRPRKTKPDAGTPMEESLVSQNQQQQPKRGRGRPPKHG